MIDLHIHILPGLDDGADTIADALTMGRMAVDDGITIMVVTPHMLDGLYCVQRDRILNGVRELQEVFEEEHLPLRLLPGADVHGTVDLPERVRAGEIVTVADQGKYLMVELSQDVLPQGIQEMFFALQLAGMTPIISHPERNIAVQAKPSVLFSLVHAGTLLQVTAASLTGRFGRTAERCARELLEADVVHVVASDAHDTVRRPPGLARARAVIERAAGTEKASEIFEQNPQHILDGARAKMSDPLAQRELRTKRRWGWKRK